MCFDQRVSVIFFPPQFKLCDEISFFLHVSDIMCKYEPACFFLPHGHMNIKQVMSLTQNASSSSKIKKTF